MLPILGRSNITIHTQQHQIELTAQKRTPIHSLWTIKENIYILYSMVNEWRKIFPFFFNYVCTRACIALHAKVCKSINLYRVLTKWMSICPVKMPILNCISKTDAFFFLLFDDLWWWWNPYILKSLHFLCLTLSTSFRLWIAWNICKVVPFYVACFIERCIVVDLGLLNGDKEKSNDKKFNIFKMLSLKLYIDNFVVSKLLVLSKPLKERYFTCIKTVWLRWFIISIFINSHWTT